MFVSMFVRSVLFFAVLLSVSSAVAEKSVKPILIPQPKSVQFRPGNFQVYPTTVWTISGRKRDERLDEAIQSILPAEWKPKIVFKKTKEPWTRVVASSDATIDAAQAVREGDWVRDEGYRLLVSSNNIVLDSQTAAGSFYGIQTLRQLLNTDQGKVACPAVQIEDWPSMKFRGAHFFPSGSGFPMHQALIERVFASFKMNNAVIQCEAARWKSHPKIAATNSISKQDLRTLVENCREHFIEPIPLINVPGHAEWIFRNGQNLEFCEDPKTPYAYCIKNPKSDAFIKDILKEAIDVFEPHYFHLGHDEIAMRGRFPNPACPRCRNSNATELMTSHANRLSDWLLKREIKPMIWGDMLLGPGEAKDATHARTVTDASERRARLNKQIIITDWHYVWNADTTSFEIFKHAGFKTIAASWNNTSNIYRLSHAAQGGGADGLLQTTWMGYFPDERALERQADQFAAFILAAEYAWSGRAVPPTELGYNPKEVFFKGYRGQK